MAKEEQKNRFEALAEQVEENIKFTTEEEAKSANTENDTKAQATDTNLENLLGIVKKKKTKEKYNFSLKTQNKEKLARVSEKTGISQSELVDRLIELLPEE